eukprot:SAG22_NODE_11_length_35583_cov_107.128790_3_plen_190_part_00
MIASLTIDYHQDRWAHNAVDPKVTIYLPLDEQTERSGCMHLARRSHCFDFDRDAEQTSSGYLKRGKVSEMLRVCPPVRCELEAGEILVFSTYLFHRSGLNSTANPRRAFSVTLTDASANRTAAEHVDSFGDGTDATVLFGTTNMPAKLGHGAHETRYWKGMRGELHGWKVPTLGDEERLAALGLTLAKL